MRCHKISIHTPRMVIGNSEGGEGGRGVISMAQVFKRKHEAKLEIPGVEGSKPKNHPYGRYGYFLESHIMMRLSLNY